MTEVKSRIGQCCGITCPVAVKLQIIRIVVELIQLVIYLVGNIYIGMLDTDRQILVERLFGIDAILSSVTVA